MTVIETDLKEILNEMNHNISTLMKDVNEIKVQIARLDENTKNINNRIDDTNKRIDDTNKKIEDLSIRINNLTLGLVSGIGIVVAAIVSLYANFFPHP